MTTHPTAAKPARRRPATSPSSSDPDYAIRSFVSEHAMQCPLDLVPVFSWLALRGRCRQCKTKIGVEPIVLELTTAALFVVFTLKFKDDAVLPAFWVLAATLTVQTWIDLRTQRLPRPITYAGMILGGIALIVAALVRDEPERIWMAALGAAIAGAMMAAIYYASRGGMGFGPGNDAGAGERHVFPGPRKHALVLRKGFETHRQRPLLALRAQPRIDLVQRPLGGRHAERSDDATSTAAEGASNTARIPSPVLLTTRPRLLVVTR